MLHFDPSTAVYASGVPPLSTAVVSPSTAPDGLPYGGVPVLLQEPVSYPPCTPASVRILFDASTVLQDEGKYGSSVNSLMAAQTAWEGALLQQHFPDVEDKEATAVLPLLRMNDTREDLRARVAALSAKPRQNDADSEFAVEERAIAAEVTVAAAAEEEYLQQRETRRKEKVAAVHRCYALLPLEGKIYIQLRLGSIYGSAGVDERALVTILHALQIAQRFVEFTSGKSEGNGEVSTVTVQNSHAAALILATVYAHLGIVYSHIAQYDLAADNLFRALQIREELLSAYHVETATVAHNVGCVLHLMCRADDALALYYRALTVFKQQFHPAHPRIEICELNIKKSKEARFNGLRLPPVPFVECVPAPKVPGAQMGKIFHQKKKK